ncbi:MAG: rhamnan synthesis F family protein [Lachnospiraceae bacterium]|nr:rhamnan synthesis F family protein [Lachnospiraceae bacterium]
MDIKMKKRLCIYVTYDSENVIDDYIGYMLQEIKKVCASLVVVCNSESISQGMSNLQKYADKIFFRKNIGFDAGAYKDTLCRYLGWDEVYQYDELILANDSFYGPFSPIEDVFWKMEQDGADYWGMTRSFSGIYESGEVSFPSHIQSYFLCFSKAVLHCTEFREFWEKFLYPQNMSLAVFSYEVGLNQYISNLGFRGAALTDFSELSYIKENENPYLLYPVELICLSHVPILKRKSLDLGNPGFRKALEAYEYIKKETAYDTIMIQNHLLRISQSVANQGMISFPDLEKFYHSHSKIFIYGSGIYGNNLAFLFEYFGWTFDGFLVTDSDGQDSKCFIFKETVIEPDDGIILAVGKKELFMEILDNIGTRCSREQLLFPNYFI